jgi:hypothetical protein
MSNLPKLPDLGQFFGDQGGPGVTTPNTPDNGNRPTCPFIDEQMGEFCTLDGAMCPFVGFNYRRCRKYTNNMAKGNMKAMEPSAANSSGGGPPRVESWSARRLVQLNEARKPKKSTPKKTPQKVVKKGGPKKAPDIAGIRVSDLPPEVQALAGHIAHIAQDVTVPDEEKKRLVKRFLTTDRTPDVARSYYTSDDPDYIERQRQAKLLAAALHLLHGVPPNRARDVGADFADVAHSAAREVLQSRNQAGRDAAYSHADASASTFFGNPQSDKPRGGPTSSDPEDIETTRAARGADRETEFPPPPDGGDYAPEYPGEPEPAGVSKSKRRFTFKPRQRGIRHERPGARPFHDEPAEPQTTPYRGRGADKRHAQQSSKYMNYDQFDRFVTDHIESLGPQELKDVLSGIGKPGASSRAEAIKHLRDLAAKEAEHKNYKAIADSYKLLWDRVSKIHDTRFNEVALRRAWEANMRSLSKYPIGDQEAYKLAVRKTSQDPKAQEEAAKFMNKLMDRLYDIETKTMKIGKSELTTFVRKVTLPEFKRSDYETIRMAEQMGLAAIHKQHQYGKGYGRWNTLNLFFKQVVMPLVLAFHPKEYSGLIGPIMKLWPQEFLDAFYFSFIQKNLPKLHKGDKGQLQPSRDTNFLNSQKMASGRRERIMRGWDNDAPLPPDRAVLHTRWYPTTKETWGKRRQGELTKRYQELQAKPPKVTRRSFL